MAPFDAMVQRAKDMGDIPPNSLAADLIAGTVGPLLPRRWFSKEPLDDRFVRLMVDAAGGAATR